MSNNNRIKGEALPQTVRLYDAYTPGIGFGAYRLALQQSVTLPDGTHHYYRDQRFVVIGPRYTLPEDDIHALYPPDGATGDFHTTLPHIVLRKRALPWEREAWPKQPQPWLALLIMTQDELEDAAKKLGLLPLPDGVPPSPNPLLTALTPKKLLAANGKDGEMLLPRLDQEDPAETGDEKTQARLLRLPPATFRELCPSKTDLSALAHVRCVDPADKIPLKMHANGDFAVLMGNRLPQPGINHVFLVSLEGMGDIVDGTRSGLADAKSAGVVTLASWTFNNDAAGNHTFGELMRDLDTAWLAVTPAGQAGADAAADTVKQALARGYVPLEYRPAGGESTFGWYRGPLTATPMSPLADDAPLFHRADAALILDDDTGLYDFSYAAAWQFGRLHVLSTPSAAQVLRAFIDQRHDAYAIAQAVEQFLQGATHRSEIEQAWQAESEMLATEIGRAEPGPAREAMLQELRDAGVPQAVLDRLEKTSAPQAPAAPATLDEPEMADTLLHFLAELALLYPLPYAYLVAHPKLLPPESIRFFYIDDNYIDALVEGALSAVQECARDRQAVATARPALDAAVSQLVARFRRHLQGLLTGVEPEQTPDATYFSATKTGFLLRSAVVSGWPGVEIRCYDAQGKKLSLLRFDRVAPDLLLCLAEAEIHTVIFKEPDEGLRFGFEDDGKIMLRQLQGGPVGQPIKVDNDEQKLEKQPADFQRAGAAAGVLDVDALRQALAGRLVDLKAMPNGQTVGPAAFALQLLRSPEKQQIDVFGHKAHDALSWKVAKE